MVSGDGGDPSPIVDARIEQPTKVFREVGRGLKVDLLRQDETSERDGLQILVAVAGRSGVHGRARLGQEILDNDLLNVAPAPMRISDGL